MMAMLLANQIIIRKVAFSQVPPSLKQPVATLLLDFGCPYLVPEEYGGAMQP